MADRVQPGLAPTRLTNDPRMKVDPAQMRQATSLRTPGLCPVCAEENAPHLESSQSQSSSFVLFF
jgi:hypothetical protein